MRSIKARAILAFLLLGATGSAWASGAVGFNVPLDVKSYPVANGHVEVWCELRNAQGQALEANAVSVKLINGASSGGFVHVAVHYGDQEAAALRSYRCALVPDMKTNYMPMMNAAKSIPLGATILQQVSGPLK